MTRLSEALERARSASGDVAPAPLRRPSPVVPPTLGDVPQTWQFEDEHRGKDYVEPAAADITDVWQLASTGPDVNSTTPAPDLEVRWNLPFSIGIDTGATFGGSLTAIRLPDETLFQT